MVWVIAVVVLVAIVGVGLLALQRSKKSGGADPSSQATPSSAPKPRPPEAPMSGLESALSDVTDSDGRPIGERIDAGAQHVDDLRVPDDTGPVLRRALDHVESSADSPADQANQAEATDAGERGERPGPPASAGDTDPAT